MMKLSERIRDCATIWLGSGFEESHLINAYSNIADEVAALEAELDAFVKREQRALDAIAENARLREALEKIIKATTRASDGSVAQMHSFVNSTAKSALQEEQE